MTADNKALVADARVWADRAIRYPMLRLVPAEVAERYRELADALEAATVDQARANELATTKTLLRDVTHALSAEIKAREAADAEIEDWKQGSDAEANLGDSARAEVRRMKPVVEAVLQLDDLASRKGTSKMFYLALEKVWRECNIYRKWQRGAETPHVRSEK